MFVQLSKRSNLCMINEKQPLNKRSGDLIIIHPQQELNLLILEIDMS